MTSQNSSPINHIDTVLDDILAEHPTPPQTYTSLSTTAPLSNDHASPQSASSEDVRREFDRRSELRRRSRLSRRAMEQQREMRRLADSNITNNSHSSTSTPPRLPLLATRVARLPSPGRQMPTPLSTLTNDTRQLSRNRSRDIRNGPTTSQTIGALYELHRAGRELESESRHLRSLLNEPILSDPRNGGVQRDIEREIVEEMHAQQHRKRRRTNSTAYGPDPTQLVMELESCDGGLYSDLHGDYAAANVLKDDDSVYCTKGNRCNLVLRHRGSVPFSLQEIHIRAPCSGYTAPVQEGMIFISMDTDETFTRTAQYRIQYSPIRRSTSTRPVIDPRRDPDDAPYDLAPTPSERDYRLAEIPSDFEARTAGPFEITMSCSDDEDAWNAPDPRRPNRRIPPNRIGHLRFEETDSEADADTDRNLRGAGRYRNHDPPGINQRLLRSEYHSLTERSPSLVAAIDAADGATQEAVKAVGGGLMVPHARFFIQSDMNRCTIRFDPPVSGRFVLLKMWSPQHRQGGNIDVQSVVIKGFAGARTFPSITPM